MKRLLRVLVVTAGVFLLRATWATATGQLLRLHAPAGLGFPVRRLQGLTVRGEWLLFEHHRWRVNCRSLRGGLWLV